MDRFVPSTPVRRALAARFGLPYNDVMQDWEYEVADASRFPEFLEAYHHADLSNAERTTLMEVLVQCVEDISAVGALRNSEGLAEWQALAEALRQRANLHAATIEYWSCPGEPDPSLRFAVSASMRVLRNDLREATS